jgi:hypothetical protein
MSAARWYEGKECARCGKRFGRIRWGNKPLLLAPDGTAIESGPLRAERIAELLTTHKPICWECSLSRAFGRGAPPTES